jgi:hypothetical protein
MRARGEHRCQRQTYRATFSASCSRPTSLQTGRVYINTQGIFRIGDSQMQFTGSGKMTISTVITDPTTGNQSMETDYVTLQGSSSSSSSSASSSTSGGGILA